jgi:hypothetical protein
VAFGLAAAAGEDVVAGAVAGGFVVAVLAAGEATAPGAAGRSPRLLGLFSMVPARLLTIFASFMATSTRAAFRMSDRCFMSA